MDMVHQNAFLNICSALQVTVPKQLHNPRNAINVKLPLSLISTSSLTRKLISDVDNSSFTHLHMLFGDIFEGENIQEDCYNSTTLISNLGVSQY